MSSAAPIKVTALQGKVTRDSYASGTKSERQAVFVDTAQGRFLLRRKTGPAFADPDLDRFVGKAVECDGFIVGTTLLAERIDILP